MAYLEELLPEFRNGAKIRRKDWPENLSISLKGCCGLNVAFYDVDADDWEIYQEPIDWKYIIEKSVFAGSGIMKVWEISWLNWKISGQAP